MKRLLLLLCIGCMALCGFAEEFIVLKNGKKFMIPGESERKGNYVVFTMENGQVVQLPVSQVDLAKSEEMTAAYHAKLEAEAIALANAVPPPPPEREIRTMGDIAAEIEARNEAEKRKVQPFSLDQSKLEDYKEENPRPTNQAAQDPYELSESSDYKNVMAKTEEFKSRYQALTKDIQELERELNEAKRNREVAEQESAFGDSLGANYDLMERYEKQIKEMQELKAKKEQELKDLDQAAREANVVGYKR